MRVLGRLIVAAAVVMALGLTVAPDTGAAPNNGTTKERTENQRQLCEIHGGTFTTVGTGAADSNTTLCTGGGGGNRGCLNTPSTTSCTTWRTPEPPDHTTSTEVPGKRVVETGPRTDTTQSTSAEQPVMTLLDKGDG